VFGNSTISSTTDDIFAAKIDKSGVFKNVLHITGTGWDDYGLAIYPSTNSMCKIIGHFDENFKFNKSELQTKGGRDNFIANISLN